MEQRHNKSGTLGYASNERHPELLSTLEDDRLTISAVKTRSPSRVIPIVILLAVLVVIDIQVGREILDGGQKPIQMLLVFIALAVAGAGALLALSLTRVAAGRTAFLSMTRQEVEYYDPSWLLGGIRFPTSELTGARVETLRTKNGEIRQLRLLRTKAAKIAIFNGISEDELGDAVDQMRLFMCKLNPSPMVDAVIPPRPKL